MWLCRPGGGLKPHGEGEGPSSHASYANIHMAGQDVFKFAVRTVPAVSRGRKGDSGDWGGGGVIGGVGGVSNTRTMVVLDAGSGSPGWPCGEWAARTAPVVRPGGRAPPCQTAPPSLICNRPFRTRPPVQVIDSALANANLPKVRAAP